MSRVKLSATQHNVLVWLNGQRERLLCGPMMDPAYARRGSYAFVGAGPYNGILMKTGDRLLALGFIRHIRDDYPRGYFAITDAGRAALQEAGHER